MQVQREPGELHTAAEAGVHTAGVRVQVQAAEELQELLQVRVLSEPRAAFRNRRRRLNLRDFLYHKWDKTYITLPFCGSLRAPD